MGAVATDEAGLIALVYGGAVLGGGGGGSIEAGIAEIMAVLRAGRPRVLSLCAVPPAAMLVTLSAVGSQGDAVGAALTPAHFRRAIKLFSTFTGHQISGFIASEVGPRAVTYGLLESTRTGIPVIDAPANGRAHPLFAMGSLGLHRNPSCGMPAIAVGGKPGTSGYVELAVRTNVTKTARIIRARAGQDKIALAVARNAAPASYVGRHGAAGGLAYAQRVGNTFLAALPKGPRAILAALSATMGGQVLAMGYVASVNLSEQNGFLIGAITIERNGAPVINVPVCNEYLSVYAAGQSAATFPDLITLFDCATGLPLSSAEVKPRRNVAIFAVPRCRLILGSPMRDRRLVGDVLARFPPLATMV